MVIRLNEKYRGPIPRDRLYDAVKASKSYGIVNEGEVWCISHDSADEVDELEEEFSRLCEIVSDNNVFFGSHREHELGAGKFSVILENQSAQESYCIRKKDIPALILALLKLMED